MLVLVGGILVVAVLLGLLFLERAIDATGIIFYPLAAGVFIVPLAASLLIVGILMGWGWP